MTIWRLPTVTGRCTSLHVAFAASQVDSARRIRIDSHFALVSSLLVPPRSSHWLSAQAVAGPPSDVLLPRTTKGYVSVAQPAEFEERWDKTQFGQMLNDEVMQPFVEDLRKQLQDKYRAVEDKLGITWDDLEGVAGRRDEPFADRAQR